MQIFLLLLSAFPLAQAFVLTLPVTSRCPPPIIVVEGRRLMGTPDCSNDSIPTTACNSRWKIEKLSAALAGLVAVALSAPFAAIAVSGGGLDYANLDLSGQDFSNGNYKGKDFTQVIAKATTFAGSNLQGCRFYKAYLVKADFTGADIRGASLEATSMDEASLKNVIAVGAYFSKSVMDTQSIENGDFTNALIPTKTQALMCERQDAMGTNPTTGADTRESLMCL